MFIFPLNELQHLKVVLQFLFGLRSSVLLRKRRSSKHVFDIRSLIGMVSYELY